MRRTVICGLSGSPVFLTLSHKLHDFRKRNPLLNIKFVLIFSAASLSLSLSLSLKKSSYEEMSEM
jgi:hypothetical protein